MRAMGGSAAGQLGFVRGFTRYQWLVFFVVWAGWSLDATDFGLFSLVLRPALTELLGGQPTIAEIGRVGGLLSTVGLLGWAFGGFLFGIIADYIGRVRTLALSILIYSVFTGLQGLSHSPFEFGIYRFFAGVDTTLGTAELAQKIQEVVEKHEADGEGNHQPICQANKLDDWMFAARFGKDVDGADRKA